MFENATVYIVDDDEQARESVSALVRSMGLNTELFASAEEFLEQVHRVERGCLVTDLRMLGMSGVELQDALLQRDISLPVILITAYPRTSLTVRAMKHGAITLLEKPYEDDDLWDAVRDGLQRDQEQHDKRNRLREIRRRLDSLSEKQQEVIDMMVDGTANKVIARRLDVSIRTVENRRHDIFEKMQANSLAELVRMVVAVREDASQIS
jgi:FixJ family two-component response regulator